MSGTILGFARKGPRTRCRCCPLLFLCHPWKECICAIPPYSVTKCAMRLRPRTATASIISMPMRFIRNVRGIPIRSPVGCVNVRGFTQIRCMSFFLLSLSRRSQTLASPLAILDRQISLVSASHNGVHTASQNFLSAHSSQCFSHLIAKNLQTEF